MYIYVLPNDPESDNSDHDEIDGNEVIKKFWKYQNQHAKYE
jgi:hypothetical protein